MVETFIGIQLITTLFAIFMIYIAFMHYKRGNLALVEFVFWIAIWLILMFFALFSNNLTPVLNKYFFARTMDLLTIGALVVLSYLGFANHMGVKTMQREIEALVRRTAIKNAKRKNRL